MGVSNQVKQKVRKILEENNVNKPPVPVIRLVQNYGYEVLEGDLPNDVAGFVDPDNHVIFINKLDPEGKRTYTIMKCLGLIVMYEDEIEDEPDKGIIYRKPVSQKSEVDLQNDAAEFASEALVPYEMIEELLKEYEDIADISGLSKVFGVDPELIQERLKLFNNGKKNGD